MTIELNAIQRQNRSGSVILSFMGESAPAFGMIGTLIGLVQMLRTLDDPSAIGSGMAVALITTFYGALAANLPAASLSGAVVLALGIGLQNLPEGMAVSVPLRRDGQSAARSFWYGQLSGFFEPLAGVVGAAAVLAVRPLLPYALAFAAGAMLYVVVEELIPEAQRDCSSHRSTFGAMLGFVVMMVLEVALT
jgi:ZIP family zinc transporter